MPNVIHVGDPASHDGKVISSSVGHFSTNIQDDVVETGKEASDTPEGCHAIQSRKNLSLRFSLSDQGTHCDGTVPTKLGMGVDGHIT